mmetsp:Transcript_22905/g.66192  ORF Transcript_22905/g.66192 Transcript_22905/m.66192 type:complete len:254 (+) Transcript_22905:371-1132(+)
MAPGKHGLARPAAGPGVAVRFANSDSLRLGPSGDLLLLQEHPVAVGRQGHRRPLGLCVGGGRPVHALWRAAVRLCHRLPWLPRDVPGAHGRAAALPCHANGEEALPRPAALGDDCQPAEDLRSHFQSLVGHVERRCPVEKPCGVAGRGGRPSDKGRRAACWAGLAGDVRLQPRWNGVEAWPARSLEVPERLATRRRPVPDQGRALVMPGKHSVRDPRQQVAICELARGRALSRQPLVTRGCAQYFALLPPWLE